MDYKDTGEILEGLKALGEGGAARAADVAKKMHELGTASAEALKAHQNELASLRKENGALLDRIEELEAKASSPGKTGGGRETKEAREHRERFDNWLRRPSDHAAKAMLAEAEAEIERKTVTVGTGASGGFAVPEEISREIERRANLLNPFRQLVTVRQIGTSRFHELVDMNDSGSGWVGESGTRSETATSKLRDRQPPMGTLYAYPKASEESLQDIFFDVQGWLVETASDLFAVEEAKAIVSGNGTSKPAGFLNATPVTTVDDASPMRSADALMYVPSGAAAAPTPDAMLAIATSSLKERYVMGEGVAWVMHRAALAQVRQLKDGSGRYVWAESLTPGTPGTLCGYPVYTSDAMPAPAANQFPIAFGNWRRGYVLVDRAGLRISVDDNITTPGMTKFYIRRRVGGIIRNNDALRVVKYATT